MNHKYSSPRLTCITRSQSQSIQLYSVLFQNTSPNYITSVNTCVAKKGRILKTLYFTILKFIYPISVKISNCITDFMMFLYSSAISIQTRSIYANRLMSFRAVYLLHFFLPLSFSLSPHICLKHSSLCSFHLLSSSPLLSSSSLTSFPSVFLFFLSLCCCLCLSIQPFDSVPQTLFVEDTWLLRGEISFPWLTCSPGTAANLPLLSG